MNKKIDGISSCTGEALEFIPINYIYKNIYIFIAIALDESTFLDVLHFPMKNIMSRDLEAMPLGEAASKPIQ